MFYSAEGAADDCGIAMETRTESRDRAHPLNLKGNVILETQVRLRLCHLHRVVGVCVGVNKNIKTVIKPNAKFAGRTPWLF